MRPLRYLVRPEKKLDYSSKIYQNWFETNYVVYSQVFCTYNDKIRESISDMNSLTVFLIEK